VETCDDNAATIQMIISFNKRGETMTAARLSGPQVAPRVMAGATPAEAFTAL
jgi:hypothetical protein